MSRKLLRNIPILGVLAAMGQLAISSYQYAGDVHWTRLTVSLLCSPTLPNGDPNLVRGPSIAALVLLCGSMALLFQLISVNADTRTQQNSIQIAGIGSMVYALLTATPMHNLMVNIALAFFMFAIFTIVHMLFRKQLYVLAFLGVVCIALKITSVSIYYTNTYTESWGLLQKCSFILTTIWLFAVLFAVEPKSVRDKPDGHT